MTDHPITPPPELVQQLRSEAPHGIRDAGVTRELHLIAAAYRAGADIELEACVEWLTTNSNPRWAVALQDGRRPKQPSLKEQALEAQQRMWNGGVTREDWELVRHALEQLDD